MSRYTFDTIIDRTQTESVKWDSDILAHLVGRGDSIPLWVADMDFQSPPEVIEALHARISHGIFGYPSPHALEKTRTSFCSWTERRHGWKIPQEQVVLSPGVISSIAYLILLSTQPGDRIVVQTPVYQPFYRIIESHGRAAVDNPLIYDELTHSYRMDFKDLEEKLSCPETTMMLFCSPHNPTGRVWTRRELEQVNELCDTYDVKIISDEIHADLTTLIMIISLSHPSSSSAIRVLSPAWLLPRPSISQVNISPVPSFRIKIKERHMQPCSDGHLSRIRESSPWPRHRQPTMTGNRGFMNLSTICRIISP